MIVSPESGSHNVCCSDASEKVHALLGYDTSKMFVINNGFDVSRFNYQENAKTELVQHTGIISDKVRPIESQRHH